MKLLLDANISHKLVERLADLFPDSSHVRAVGLHAVGDREVWEFARSEGFVIVSKDEDFHQLAFLHGPPPKFVWVRLGNCTTEDVEQAIRRGADRIADFVADEEEAVLVI